MEEDSKYSRIIIQSSKELVGRRLDGGSLRRIQNTKRVAIISWKYDGLVATYIDVSAKGYKANQSLIWK